MIRLRSPLSIIDDTGSIGAAMQRRSHQARFIPDRLDEARPLLDQLLLLCGLRLKNIDDRHQIIFACNMYLFLLSFSLLAYAPYPSDLSKMGMERYFQYVTC